MNLLRRIRRDRVAEILAKHDEAERKLRAAFARQHEQFERIFPGTDADRFGDRFDADPEPPEPDWNDTYERMMQARR